MSFRGDIASIALGDVVQNLVVNRKTGTLTIRSGDVERYIQFDGGDIVSYSDARGGVEYPRWLVQKGVVSDDDMRTALRKKRRSTRRTLGQILEKLNAIDGETYVSYLQQIVNDALCESFTLTDGVFDFVEGDLDAKKSDAEVLAYQFRFSAQNLIMESARRADDWEQIRRHLPPESAYYCASPAERQRIAEKAETSEDSVTPHVIELFDGSLSIGEVIERAPFSRFDAVHSIAELVANKKIRPVDSSRVVEQSGDADPRSAIARLEVLLDREPGNLQVLEKLAAIHESSGSPEEAAKYLKLRANAHLEERDFESARACFRKTIGLNSRDVISWQRLWDCSKEIGDDDEIERFGGEFLAHFKKLGLMEIVRDHLEELLARYPDRLKLKRELALAHFALGETKEGLQGLFDLGHELLRRKSYEQAESCFAEIQKFDPKNERAIRIRREIQTGQIERRRVFRRRVLREAIGVGLLVLGGWFILREIRAQSELLQVVRTVFAERMFEDRHYSETRERIEAVRERYPLSPTASGHARALLDALTSKEDARTWQRPAGDAAPSPDAKDER